MIIYLFPSLYIHCMCIISFLYTPFSLILRQLRNNNGKLLLNLSCALLGLYVMFIVALFATSVDILCVLVSALLHYFLLACFLAMASEAVVLYIELVQVFAEGKKRLALKAILVTWSKWIAVF